MWWAVREAYVEGDGREHHMNGHGLPSTSHKNDASLFGVPTKVALTAHPRRTLGTRSYDHPHACFRGTSVSFAAGRGIPRTTSSSDKRRTGCEGPCDDMHQPHIAAVPMASEARRIAAEREMRTCGASVG